MGIITRTAKAPAPQVIRNQPVSVSQNVTPSEPEKTDAEIAGEARTESLLRRSRSRFGTILTGFKGFLDTSNQSDTSARKTLLGE